MDRDIPICLESGRPHNQGGLVGPAHPQQQIPEYSIDPIPNTSPSYLASSPKSLLPIRDPPPPCPKLHWGTLPWVWVSATLGPPLIGVHYRQGLLTWSHGGSTPNLSVSCTQSVPPLQVQAVPCPGHKGFPGIDATPGAVCNCPFATCHPPCNGIWLVISLQLPPEAPATDWAPPHNDQEGSYGNR